MRFLVDNSLSPRFAQGLRLAGHEALHVRDIGMAAAKDEAIFDEAASRDCIVLCEDTDFGTLLASRRVSRPSVILFRCRAKSVEALLPLLLGHLPAIATDLDAGAMVVFEDARIRVRRLPIAGG
jgi:predicted nuclease of predicted toxin-antitoxin system